MISNTITTITIQFTRFNCVLLFKTENTIYLFMLEIVRYIKALVIPVSEKVKNTFIHCIICKKEDPLSGPLLTPINSRTNFQHKNSIILSISNVFLVKQISNSLCDMLSYSAQYNYTLNFFCNTQGFFHEWSFFFYYFNIKHPTISRLPGSVLEFYVFMLL